MFISSLAAAPIVLAVAFGPSLDEEAPPPRHMSLQQRSAAVQPLQRSATECIVRAVASDPRSHQHGVNLGDLIVASMPSCTGPVRAMIGAYDRYFGQGSGEAFFMGPYLDLLPKVLARRVQDEGP